MTVSIKNDVPTFTFDGTKKWRTRKMLKHIAVTHLSLSKTKIAAVFSRMADVVIETRTIIPIYITHHPEFREVGKK